MVYITGDTHGNFNHIENFCVKNNTSKDDVLIILGDVGLNYYRDDRDDRIKKICSKFPITLFCLRGNHDFNQENIRSYVNGRFFNNAIIYEEKYPNILFAKNGLLYNIDGYLCMTIGGGYSVDKYYRLSKGWNWFDDEQISDVEKIKIESAEDYTIADIFLTHTCPYKYIPQEVFLPQIDQSTVDNSTELWLDEIEKKSNYRKWYCGHYHTQKIIDKMNFMFSNIEEFKL